MLLLNVFLSSKNEEKLRNGEEGSPKNEKLTSVSRDGKNKAKKRYKILVAEWVRKCTAKGNMEKGKTMKTTQVIKYKLTKLRNFIALF